MIRYAITSGSYLAGDAARWARDGVEFVQLREKRAEAGELTDLARSILADIAQVPGAPTRLLINGRADVALAAGAHGVHLTSHPGELTPQQVHRVFEVAGAGVPLVSVSCHTLQEVRRAQAAGADLVLFGPVFEKRVARQLITDGSGLELLEFACKAAQGTPVLALGGVTQQNAAACLAAGASGIAAIRLFA